MELTIISSKNLQPIKWSGGSATELFIFPLTADYKLRNFQFRLSTATVETDESEFTSLYGITRKLMILSGKIILNHTDHYSRQLNKFDVEEFEGDWKTSSIGKCTDFNLMTTGKTTGELTAIELEKNEYVYCRIRENCDWYFIYIFSGNVRIEINKKIAVINKGDLVILNKMATKNFEIKGVEYSEVVFSEITL